MGLLWACMHGCLDVVDRTKSNTDFLTSVFYEKEEQNVKRVVRKGELTLQLSWTSKTNACALTSFFK